MSERKIYNFKSEVLVEMTIDKEGYDPGIFGNTSIKFLWAQCRVCGLPHRIRKGFFIKAGSACHKKCRLKEQEIKGSPFANPLIREKARKTNLVRYGFEQASQNKEIAQKISDAKKIEVSKEETKVIIREKPEIKDICIINCSIKLNNTKVPNMTPYTIDSSQFIDVKSKTIDEIKKCIEDLGLTTEINDRSIISPLELDIYIPDKKFAIEFNGSYWHSEAFLEPKVARMKHLTKLLLCYEKNVRLFQIFECDWRDRKKQIFNFIKSCLGQSKIKIMARKCIIDNNRDKGFMDDNHIQGWGMGTIKYFNLTYHDEIVASMTASKHHRQNVGDNLIVLNRLCFKDGVTVQGGATKLFKQFADWAREEKYSKIVSWSDNTITPGGIYDILGFKFEKEYGPDYFYWDMKKDKYVSKQSKKKSNTGCPKEITEREWNMKNGFFKIHDCGKKLWIYELK